MSDLQNAILWWRQLFLELGNTSCTGDQDKYGQLARDRVVALSNLFFSLAKELRVHNLLEIGAHNAESSRRFVGLDPSFSAYAYEASEKVYSRVSSAGLPERVAMYNNALASKSGPIEFLVPVEQKFQVWGSTKKRKGDVQVDTVTVSAITLDEAVDRIPKANSGRDVAVWMDVEGGAHDVLAGGLRSLQNRISYIYMEVNDFETYEGSSTIIQILEYLFKLGFVPIARDNQYHDAWNLLIAHESAYSNARMLIAHWMYKNSGVTNVLRAVSDSPK